MGTFSLYLIATKQTIYPKDYAKNKDKLLKEFQDSSATNAWQKYVQELGTKADVQLSDPALDAFKTQSSPMLATGASDARNDALKKYDGALSYAAGDEAAAIHYQKARLLFDLKQPDKYIAELTYAVDAARDALPVRLELARALREGKDSKSALEQLQTASKQLENAPATPSIFGGNPNDALHAQIASEYEALGRRDLAAAERKKITPPANRSGAPGSSNVITMPGGLTPQPARP